MSKRDNSNEEETIIENNQPLVHTSEEIVNPSTSSYQNTLETYFVQLQQCHEGFLQKLSDLISSFNQKLTNNVTIQQQQLAERVHQLTTLEQNNNQYASELQQMQNGLSNFQNALMSTN
eukprot:TRINITY_DN4054_c0_g1_i1.p1 TRINITY_DN4054_c0_g1~~TRINITY_DN4054_c0_g1_i1.p1  ORF type:complete len:119 (+),score=42.78 TRINITY_DN4054_c0_g1_i1:4-360(+)